MEIHDNSEMKIDTENKNKNENENENDMGHKENAKPGIKNNGGNEVSGQSNVKNNPSKMSGKETRNDNQVKKNGNVDESINGNINGNMNVNWGSKKSFADILRGKSMTSSNVINFNGNNFNNFFSNNGGFSSKENSTSASVLSMGFNQQSLITPSTSVTPNKQTGGFTVLSATKSKNGHGLRKHRRQRLSQRRQRQRVCTFVLTVLFFVLVFG